MQFQGDYFPIQNPYLRLLRDLLPFIIGLQGTNTVVKPRKFSEYKNAVFKI